MKTRFKQAYLDVARRFAELSHARRLHVGAIVVKDDRIISIGYNGMPAGWDNDCEDKDYMSSDAGGWLSPDEIYERWPFEETVVVANDNESFEIDRRYRLKTKPEVLHAESNAIAKLAKSNDSGNGADIFITHAPCIECAKLIYQSGINSVYYGENYRDDSGIEFLKKSGVNIEKLDN
jgi:dCMP deaminase